MDGAWIYVLISIYVLSVVLGIVGGLWRAHILKKDFPEFFSPFLSNTDKDFVDVSEKIEAVNVISDEELKHERFTQPGRFQ